MRDMYGCKDGISFGIRHCGMVWRTTNSLSCGTVCTVIPVIVSEERYGTRSLSYGYSILVIVIQLTLAVAVAAVTKAPLVTTIF